MPILYFMIYLSQVALTPVKRKLTEEAEDDKDESDVRQVRCTPKRARAAAAVVETPTKDSPRKSSDIQITPRKVGRPPKNKNNTENEQTTPKNQNDTEKEQTTPRKVSRQPKNKNDTEKESATPTKRQSAILKEEVKPSTPQKKQTRTQPRTGTPQKPIQRISEV